MCVCDKWLSWGPHPGDAPQAPLTFGGDGVAAERGEVTLDGIKAGRHQHHLRGELVGDGHHHGPGGQRLRARHGGVPKGTGTPPRGHRDPSTGHRDPPKGTGTHPRGTGTPPGCPPEGGEILHVADGGVDATRPGDVDVVAHSHPAANLGTAKGDPPSAAAEGDTGGDPHRCSPPVPPQAPRCPGRSCRRRSGGGRCRGRRGRCRRLAGSRSRGGCPAGHRQRQGPPSLCHGVPTAWGSPHPPPWGGLTQSTMRILPTLSFCWSSLAEMATELKKQKPLGERAG